MAASPTFKSAKDKKACMDKNHFRIKNYRHAYILVFEYIETFYNTVRIHSHCNYMSPNEFEKAYEKVKKISMPVAS